MCDRCYSFLRIKQSTKDDEKKSLDERMAIWETVCPSQYRENNVDIIDKSCFTSVTSWDLGPMGLMCTGASRMGKTTSCWHLLHKLYVLKGIQFEALSEPEFAQKCQEMGRARGLDSWLKKLSSVPILFLDDIGHAATSSGYLSQLYIVVENRTKWKKPIISTTQFSSAELVDRGGAKKTIEAILNRLKRASKIVVFEQ